MREQLGALKPPFWLISLPLFIVLYRNTATSPQAEDKRVDGDGDGDERPDDGDAKDKREYGEGKQQI